MRRTKILVDAHYVDGLPSGALTYLKGIFNELVKYDDLEIHLAAKNLIKLEENFPDRRFKFVKLSYDSFVSRMLFEFPRIIKSGNFAYAHFTYFIPFVKQCKYIVTIHDLLFLDFPEYFSFKYKLGRTIFFFYSAFRADILLTVSNYSKKSLIKYFGVKEDKIFITPCAISGILNGVRTNKRILSDQYILFVSRIEHRKNHIALLRAFVGLRLYENYLLIFIGAKSENVVEFNNFLESQPEPIRSKIYHFEDVTDLELMNFYQNAALFVFPSKAEGFGIPPLEALLAGSKVICSNSTAMSDFEFLCGYQFNPNNQDELDSLILRTLKEENYPSKDIVDKMTKKFSWQSSAFELYSQLNNS
jgi:glycosyltransferase involved in cell wall biosynthesis